MSQVPEKMRRLDCMSWCRDHPECGAFTLRQLGPASHRCQLVSLATVLQPGSAVPDTGTVSFKLVKEVSTDKYTYVSLVIFDTYTMIID